MQVWEDVNLLVLLLILPFTNIGAAFMPEESMWVSRESCTNLNLTALAYILSSIYLGLVLRKFMTVYSYH